MYNYFTAAFNSFPALKAGVFEAAICISSPVCGLRPVRADLSRTSNVPKPRICTFSSFASAFVIASRLFLVYAIQLSTILYIYWICIQYIFNLQ